MKTIAMTRSAGPPLEWSGRAIMAPAMKKDDTGAVERERETFWGLLAPQEIKLFNFLRQASFYSEDGDDLYQDVVLRAWKYFASFNQEKSFSTWIFTIAHNEVKKYFNRRKNDQKVISLASLANDPAAPASDPDVALVLEAARKLPDRQREIFFLFYANRFSVAEVAVITGMSQGNIKFILNRCREAVRLALEGNHEK